MGGRRRGETTKEKVLEEACKVFAEKGYRDATHAEICRRAGANVAAVNYYFGSKESLYRAVFEHLARKVERMYPLDGGLLAASPPERRLHAFIHAHLSRVFDPELLGDLHRIRMAEMFDPTGLLEELLARQLARDREQVQRLLRELLGSGASRRDVEWCEMSIVAQCLIGAPGPPDKGPRAIFGLDASEVDRLTDHILRFSMAGIKAIRRKCSEHVARARTRSGSRP
ncbi:MAG TPA: CerR family C-terminal domain-containing protein [Candidatus Hydrogenedentes bacterium]|nr:CerR family C-terminal domain-containing protein [Candidatus Hydrogenedentota bacterium]HNT86644.1 CerR family C-terminal domain-containing protein [Candidatus Hydrogenedentota bacterium]